MHVQQCISLLQALRWGGGGLSGLLGSGGKGNLFSGIYGELDSRGGGGGIREQGFDEHILRSWGERQFSFREQGTKPPSPQTR